MDKEYYKVEVIPFGKVNTKVNAEPKMLWHEGEDVYFSELPLSYHGDGNVNDNLFYLYNELSNEEKEMYKGSVEEQYVTVPEVVSNVKNGIKK